MNYKLIGPKESGEWNFRAKERAQILQSYEWGQVKGSSGWEPLYLMSDAGQAMILKRKLPVFDKSFFYIPRGPLTDFKSISKLSDLFEGVKKLAIKEKAVFVRMDPEIEDSDEVSKQNLAVLGFKKAKKEIQPRATFIIDISKSIDEIKADFESKFRYNIHIAKKNGVTVKEEKSEEGMERFYMIYEKTKERQNFIIHPLSYYKKVYSIIINQNMGTIFTAYYKNEAIASVIIFTFGDRIWYMYGASSQEFKSVMPNNLLHWEVIKSAKQMGFKKYDLWGIPSDPKEGHPLWGVYRFKKGMNGELKNFIGAYDLALKPFEYIMFDKGIELYQNAVRFVKKGTIKDSLS